MLNFMTRVGSDVWVIALTAFFLFILKDHKKNSVVDPVFLAHPYPDPDPDP